MQKKNLQKIIVQLPGRAKDVVGALPLLEALKMHFSQAELSVLVRENMRGFLRNKNIDHTIVFKKPPRFAPVLENGEDVITFIQKNEYDIGITIPTSFSSAYIFFQGMVKRRIGFKRSFGSFLLTDVVEVGNTANLLKPLGIEPSLWKPTLYARPNKYNHLHIGMKSSFNPKFPTKKWYKKITTFLLEEIPSLKISILGEETNAKEIKEIIDDQSCFIEFQSIEIDYELIIDKIHNFDALVTDDQDLIAIAKAVNTPFVDITYLLGNQQLLPEDFFSRIKDAILQPLKERVLIQSFNQFNPICQGFCENKRTVIIKKKVGVIILAGGMGRRLGLDRPKGFLELGAKNLFDILLEKAKEADKIAILTSPVTYDETKRYCEGKKIDLLEKKVYPTEAGDGVSPEGNGALYDALVFSKYWDQWRHLDIISVIAIDNPLADPLDMELISTEKQLAVIGVSRDKKEERLGVLCRYKEALVVREYFTLGNVGMEGLGYSGIFAATPQFFETVAGEQLPFYRIEKQNQAFYERLVIDGFKYAKDFEVIEKERKRCFFPIKEKRDLFTYCNEINIGGNKV